MLVTQKMSLEMTPAQNLKSPYRFKHLIWSLKAVVNIQMLHSDIRQTLEIKNYVKQRNMGQLFLIQC